MLSLLHCQVFVVVLGVFFPEWQLGLVLLLLYASGMHLASRFLVFGTLLLVSSSRQQQQLTLRHHARLVISLFWSRACQEQVAGGHAGVGVVSLGGVLLSLPSLVTPEFREFFLLGGVLRTTLLTRKGGVVHLFEVKGNKEAEEDPHKLSLNDKL